MYKELAPTRAIVDQAIFPRRGAASRATRGHAVSLKNEFFPRRDFGPRAGAWQGLPEPAL